MTIGKVCGVEVYSYALAASLYESAQSDGALGACFDCDGDTRGVCVFADFAKRAAHNFVTLDGFVGGNNAYMRRDRFRSEFGCEVDYTLRFFDSGGVVLLALEAVSAGVGAKRGYAKVVVREQLFVVVFEGRGEVFGRKLAFRRVKLDAVESVFCRFKYGFAYRQAVTVGNNSEFHIFLLF